MFVSACVNYNNILAAAPMLLGGGGVGDHLGRTSPLEACRQIPPSMAFPPPPSSPPFLLLPSTAYPLLKGGGGGVQSAYRAIYLKYYSAVGEY